MALKKHIPTIEDRIQERKDVHAMLKTSMKEVKSLINCLDKIDEQIKKLEKRKRKKESVNQSSKRLF
jgi:Tfp pilus assembly protein PilN